MAIVSAATARAFWPGEDPIGKNVRIERPDGRPVDELPGCSDVIVVGVARDIVSGLIVDGPDGGHIYFPMTAADPRAVALLIRAHSDRDLGPDTLQRLFQQVDVDPQVFEALPLDQMKALQVYPLLAASWIGSLLGAVALALSVSGLYGVLTFTLSHQTRGQISPAGLKPSRNMTRELPQMIQDAYSRTCSKERRTCKVKE